MQFYRPGLEDHARYTSHYRKCAQLGSESSFLALWSYGEEIKLERAFYKDLFWHRITWDGKRVWMPPIGAWDRPDWADLLAECARPGDCFYFVPELLALKWRESFPHRIALADMREAWDYLYSVEQQIALQGKNFSSMRRHARKFLETYAWTYSEITPALIPAVLEFQNDWMALNEKNGKMDDGLRLEHRTILKQLANWDKLPDIYGATLSVEGRVVAYVISDALDERTLSGSILKGYYEYSGVYQAMNQLFYKNTMSRFVISNDWADGGHANLREAKLGCNPVDFIKKFTVTWNG